MTNLDPVPPISPDPWSWAFVVHRPVQGCPGIVVGSDGHFWSCLVGCRWKLLKQTLRDSGHLGITLTRNGHQFRLKSHRLVLEAFVGPCPPGLECLHRNGIPSDNRLDNIRWGTRLENVADAIAHGTATIGSRNGNAKIDEPKVVEILTLLDSGLNQSEVGRRVGLNSRRINAIANGHRWRRVFESFRLNRIA